MPNCAYPSDGAVLARAEPEPDERLSKRVVAALEAAAGYDAAGGGETLYDAVDPDALDALFAETPRSDRAGGCVRFPVAGVEVAVAADGEIAVIERSDD